MEIEIPYVRVHNLIIRQVSGMKQLWDVDGSSKMAVNQQEAEKAERKLRPLYGETEIVVGSMNTSVHL